MSLLHLRSEHYVELLLPDSPLPDSRLPNGAPTVGSLGRPGSWGGPNWPNGLTGGTVAALGKPPPGRDPKSRARSRDYLKQYVFGSSRKIFLPHAMLIVTNISQMSTGNFIFNISSSHEPTTQQTLAQQFLYTLITTQRSIFRPNSLPPATESSPGSGKRLSFLERSLLNVWFIYSSHHKQPGTSPRTH